MDLQRVDEIIEAHKAEKGALISILHDIQRDAGYVPDEVLGHLSAKIHLPLSEIFRVISYFDRAFSVKPKGKHSVKVCQGTACYLKHADRELTGIKEELEKDGGGKDFDLTVVRCLGCCSATPVVEVDGKIFDKDSARSAIIKLKGEK